MTTPEGATGSLPPIEAGYYDNGGNFHKTPPETQKAILRAMGITDYARAIGELQDKNRLRLIEPVLVVSVNGQPTSIPICLPLMEKSGSAVSVEWRVEDEYGNSEKLRLKGINIVDFRTIGGIRYVQTRIPNRTDRAIGYYTVKIECKTPESALSGQMRLIIAPDRCYLPESRSWGITLSLYSLRSERNWGVGDFGDLKALALWLKGLGGGFIGINPLHAIPNRMPDGISPYYPVSRLYRNFIYLDMEAALSGLGIKADTPSEVSELRNAELVDYEKVAEIKLKTLKNAFKSFDTEHPGHPGFQQYIQREGRSLLRFAAFAALEEHFKRGWLDRPSEFKDPGTEAVKEFIEAHADEVRFYMFVQWLIERQLMEIRSLTEGMPVGLYEDLAVGSSGGGSDAWSHRDVFAFGASAGAPPDEFNPNGQNWGFPPLIPEKLRESGYELFIETIRKNLEHAGALRMDHALGLFRLFWIPEGMTPAEGAYVRYPAEDLLRIIALESVRAKAVIIAEDLGIVPDEVKAELMKFGMLSYRLFYFERQWPKRDLPPPGAYPKMALAAVTTHDLPTLLGFWSGSDIEVKKALGIYRSDEQMKRDVEERQMDKQLIVDALNKALMEGFSPDIATAAEITPQLSLAVHKYLALTPCKLISVSLDDLMGALEQQNLPGTIGEHPNWRRKARLTLDELYESPQAEELARALRGLVK